MGAMNYSSQLQYTGKGYLDSKIQPVEKLDELNNIPRSQRFIGLTVTVIDDGQGNGPHDYWLKTSVTKWELKKMPASVSVNGGDTEQA